MGNDQHRHPALRQVLHNGQDLSDHLRVQSRGRLVKEQDLRIHRHGPGNRDTLLLTARDLTRAGVDVRRHTNLVQIVHGMLPGRGFIPLQNLDLSHHAVFEH